MAWGNGEEGGFIETQRSRGRGNGPMTKQSTWGLWEREGRGGRTPSPLPMFPIRLRVGLGIKPWRGPGASLLALSSS